MVAQLAYVHGQGVEVALVTSGAVAVGRHTLGVNRGRDDIPFRQVLAAVGQGRLVQIYEQLFEAHNITVAQALLSRRDVLDREGYLNVRNTLLTLLDLKVIPIINENDVVASDEVRDVGFGDNDNLSAMVANLIDADMLIVLSDIGGLYTADPHEDPNARIIPRVEVIDEAITAMAGPRHSSRSRGGMQAKLSAIKLAAASGVAVSLVSGKVDQVVSRLASGRAGRNLLRPHCQQDGEPQAMDAQRTLHTRADSGRHRGRRGAAHAPPQPASRRCEGGGG